MSFINESIIYNIYPLGFCGAPKENDGNLAYRLDKVLDIIPHLKKLSVNAVVFNPLFESSRHGYDTIDPRRVDCRLGDNESFKRICRTLHENGIRVILDGVFNHVGREFFAFRDVRQSLSASRYCSWFQNLNFGGGSPCGDPFWYEGWAGCYDLVKLNLRNPEVTEYLIETVRLWIDEFDIDGLRLDAADCIDFDFFKRLRWECKSKKPDFWLYGEINHGDYNRWANGEMLDSVTNYECYKGIYSSHNDHNYFEIAHSLGRQFGNGGIYKGIYTYNFADNHDVDRVASTLRDKNHLKNVYTMLYTMPGVPSIYYGSEFGIEGRRTRDSDYALRPCLDLDNIENADYDLFFHIARLGKVRLALDALKYGGFDNVNIMNEKLVYKRFTESQTVFIAFNLTDREEKIGFDFGCSGVFTDALTGKQITVNGYTEITIKPYSSQILVQGEFSAGSPDDSEIVIPEVPEEDRGKTECYPSVGGRYRHFKGSEYELLAVAKHSETGEELAVYRNVSDHGSVWARPLSMFTDTVCRDGKTVLRFTPLF